MAYAQTSWEEANIVSLLCLHELLSPTQIDDLLSELSLELWFRFIQDDITPLLSEKDKQTLHEEFGTTENVVELFEWIQKHKPDIAIEPLLAKRSSQLNKEFVSGYITDIEETAAQEVSSLVKPHSKRIRAEIEAKRPNFTLIQDEVSFIRSLIYKKTS